MNRILVIAAVVQFGLWMGVVCAQAQPAESDSEAPSRRERDAGNARSADAWVDEVGEDQLDGRLYVKFHSKVIGQDYCFLIYLPPSYNEQPNRRYPVVYWLHGVRGGVLKGEHFYKHYRAALEAKQAPELILVFPKARHSSMYCDSVDGERPVESVIMKDLIPYVDSHYRTTAGREGRAVEGSSMGGCGAFHLAFKYPELFCGSTSLIGAFIGAEPSEEGRSTTQDSMFGGDFDLFHAESPWALIRKNREAIRGKMKIRIFDGDEDQFYPHNEGMHDLLRDLEIAHSYTVLAGVGHNQRSIYERMGPPMFAFYGDLFADVLKE
jgi:enterochelin esterase-like enzyme